MASGLDCGCEGVTERRGAAAAFKPLENSPGKDIAKKDERKENATMTARIVCELEAVGENAWPRPAG